tara:strand:- start:2070 stop:2663 length:594 start_codon:yes stop_codon:yes gene_type:complete
MNQSIAMNSDFINRCILSYLAPSKYDNNDLNIPGYLNFLKICSMKRSFYENSRRYFKNFDQIYQLIINFDKIYLHNTKRILYSALTSQCRIPFCIKYYPQYEDSISEIIKKIIILIPESINYEGYLKYRRNVSTFEMACLNGTVPIEIVEQIYKKLNKKKLIKLNGREIESLADLELNTPSIIGIERLNNISKMMGF